MGSVMVCGFYTEDYRRWLIPLVASLDRLGQGHDFVLAEKAGTMWETNTMAKAAHILAAMDRHPDEVIVWLDVDCIVHGDLSPLADAVEQHVNPPYRATAVRQQGTLWGVGAKRIRVAQIPFPQGERLQFSRNGDDRDFRVDGEPSHAPCPPELERVGEALGDGFYVEAQRIDEDLWEVRVSPL